MWYNIVLTRQVEEMLMNTRSHLEEASFHNQQLQESYQEICLSKW